MWLDWPDRNKDDPQPNVALNPDGIWHDYRVSGSNKTLREITALLWLERNMSVEVKGVSLGNSETTISFSPVLTKPFRSAVWFLNANYAGHSLVAFTLLILFLLPQNVWGLWATIIIGLIGGVGVYFTESRAAWFALGIGLLCSLNLLLPKWSRVWFWGATATGLALVALSGGGEFLGRLASVDQSGTTRQSIWKVAINYLTSHPFAISPASAFADVYVATYPSATEKISHAHNFWLQMGVRFGVFGIFASLVLTVLMVLFYWKQGSWKALFFLMPLLLMNFLDYSLDYAGVLVPLVLGSFWVVLSTRKNTKPSVGSDARNPVLMENSNESNYH